MSIHVKEIGLQLNSTQLNWTKTPASEHVSNSCDLVAVNNTKHDVTDLIGADWLEFMQLSHIRPTVCSSCEEVVSSCRLFYANTCSRDLTQLNHPMIFMHDFDSCWAVAPAYSPPMNPPLLSGSNIGNTGLKWNNDCS
jgi:hypothetical protein